MTTRIGIVGYAGRMGQAIGRIVQDHPDAVLVGGLDREGLLKVNPFNNALILTNRAEELFPKCDVIIDFSHHTVTPTYAKLAVEHGKAFMSGTTGLDVDAKAALDEAAKKIPVLYATNTSLSLVVMKQLVKQAAQLLRDHDYDVTILDRHHRMKKDAPSGTAVTLGEAVTAGNGGLHPPQFAALRAGFIVGDHEVSFVGQGETISLQHVVTDRDIFARGAVNAALWLNGKPSGLYNMDDVLGAGRA